MAITYFNGSEFKAMLVGSANLLAEQRAQIDALNVFPVPDGDTGTNMSLTLFAGVKEARDCPSARAGDVAEAVARGCLLGARGNSGVILSQIMQGFASALKGKEYASTLDVSGAFKAGMEAAYKAVMNPVEGTILTVLRSISEAFEGEVGKGHDMLRCMLYAYKKGQHSLARTPELLPVLKEAGVVDAGGRGLVVILEGILYALKIAASRQQLELFDLAASQQRDHVMSKSRDISTIIEFTYCTELLVKGVNLPLDNMRRELSPYGDCLMVVGGPDTAKVHIHSNHPGLVLECCLKYGALHEVHINNMEQQHQDVRRPPAERHPLGVVSVGLGEGISSIMESMGVDVVVAGGQTMNPSSEDLLNAIEKVPAEKVLVLTNNKNIVLAARQAAEMAARPVAVIPTKTIPQGMAAMLAFNPFGEMEDMAGKMSNAAGEVRSGEITRAVRETVVNERNIRNGDYIGLDDYDIVASGSDLKGVLAELVDKMVTGDTGIVTLYYGAGISGAQAQSLVEGFTSRHAGVEFEYHYGGQPLYQFIISAE